MFKIKMLKSNDIKTMLDIYFITHDAAKKIRYVSGCEITAACSLVFTTQMLVEAENDL